MKLFKFETSLRKRLSLSYILVAILCVLIISIFTNLLFEKQFRKYTKQNQQQKNAELAELISKQYNDKDLWNYGALENIGVNAIEQGMIIKVSDLSNKVIWDASVHNNGLCKKMLDQMVNNMNKYYPSWNGKYEEKSYKIYYNKKLIGNVLVGSYGPFYYNENDIAFLGTLNKILIFAGVLSLFLSLILGASMANIISIPISRVIIATENISKGFLAKRITESSKTKEINLLISSVNNLAEALEKQEDLRKQMSADVAHELRTPLTTLQGYVEAMIDGVWETDNERLACCHEEIMRIIRLVGNLEKLSKLEGENFQLQKTKYNVTEQIKGIINNFQEQFRKKGINVSINGGDQEIFADKDKISQVIINLLSNAIKYTNDNGLIEISVKSSDDICNIIIKDTGLGIAEEELPLIFERFYRVDKSRNRLTGGSGIGLTISKAIVEAHKGKIKVKSRINIGSEFILSLPKGEGL